MSQRLPCYVSLGKITNHIMTCASAPVHAVHINVPILFRCYHLTIFFLSFPVQCHSFASSPCSHFVALTMQAVGDAFNAGFYEEQVQLRGLPVLDSRPKRFMRNMSAKYTIGTKKVIQFSRISKVGHIVSVLRSNNHNGFPVCVFL
jgi:hypothetical protein